MREAEAKTKWCHAFVASHTDPRAMSANNEFAHACIGSDCMAWRETERTIDFSKVTSLDPIEALGEALALQVHGDRTGYCGLAGKP